MPIKGYQHLRSEPDLKKDTFTGKNQNLIGAVTRMRGWRKTMEDTEIFQFNIDGKGTNLFGVFDGHGGGEVSAYAKRHFKERLLNNPAYEAENYEKALEQVFPELDRLMMTDKGCNEVFQIKDELDRALKKEYRRQWFEQNSEEIECVAGSTAIVCLMTTETIYIASLGDSRCMISSGGQCTSVSIQHKPDMPQEKLRIEAAGGKIKNNRINGQLAMSRSLGDFQFKMKKYKPKDKQMVISKPQIDKVKNQNIDFILIGCDGIWQGHSDDWYFNEVQAKKQEFENPSKIVEGILDKVVAPNLEGDDGHDNMTAILVIVQDNL